jgi:hypothetical protein
MGGDHIMGDSGTNLPASHHGGNVRLLGANGGERRLESCSFL